MKKTMLIVVLIGIITSSKAQNIFPSSGNVGIGTNSPNAHLEVIKNFNGSNSAYFLNQNSSANSRVILLIGEQPSGGNMVILLIIVKVTFLIGGIILLPIQLG